MFKVRVVWDDGINPPIYEQSYLFDAGTLATQIQSHGLAVFKAREIGRRFGLKSFNLLSLESETV